jgi:hypothetical protein
MEIHHNQALRSVTKTTKEGVQVIAVGSSVVALDFKHFGYESLSRPAFDLHDEIERVRDICLDHGIGHLDATLHSLHSS